MAAHCSRVPKTENKQQSTQTVPFILVPPGYYPSDVCVRVDSPLEASGDYLQRVHRRTRNASEGLVGSVLGELSGQRPVAQEECEEMLLVGETLTGFGEVVLEGETIRLKPPVDGRAYVLMPGDHRSFIQRHEASAGMWKGLSVLFGMAGVTLIAGLVHRGVSDKKN